MQQATVQNHTYTILTKLHDNQNTTDLYDHHTLHAAWKTFATKYATQRKYNLLSMSLFIK